MDLKNTFQELLKGAGITFAGVVFARGLALGSEILFARILGPDLYGLIGLAVSLTISMSYLASFGIPQGITRFWRTATSKGEKQSLLLSSYLIVFLTSSILTSTFIFYPTFYSELLKSPSLSGILPSFSFYLITFSLGLTTVGALRGMKDAALSTLARDVLPKLLGLGVFGVYLLLGKEYIGAIAFWVFSGVFCLLFSLIFLSNRLEWNIFSIFQGNLHQVGPLLAFSWPLAIESIFQMLMINLDIIMLGYFFQPTSVGYYRSVQPLSRGLTLFLSSFTFLYLPIATDYFEAGEYDHLSQIFKSSTKWIVLVTYPLTLTFFFFSKGIVAGFFGEQYLPAAAPLSVLAIGMFLRAIVGPNGATVKAINRTQIDVIASVVGVGVNILLNLLLIPQYGLIGAAVATSVSFLAFNTVDLIVVYSSTRSHPFTVGLFKQLLPTGVLAWVISSQLTGSYLSLTEILAVGVFLSIAQVFSYVLTGCISEGDIFMLDILEEKVGISLSVIEKFY